MNKLVEFGLASVETKIKAKSGTDGATDDPVSKHN